MAVEQTVNPVGRPPGTPKTGGVKKGGIKTHTVQVKAAILRVFNELNEGDSYLRQVGKTDPKLFLSLVARLLPAESNIELNQNVRLDIGRAMQDAESRLAAAQLIEHDSGEPTPLLHHRQTDDLG
jgi:hypothetical protein